MIKSTFDRWERGREDYNEGGVSMGNLDLPAVVEGGSPQPWRLKKLWEGMKKTPPRTKSPPTKHLVVGGSGHSVPVILRKPKYPDDDEEDKSKRMKIKKEFQYKHQLPFVDDVKRKDMVAAATKQKEESAFSALKAMVLTRRRLRLDPDKHLHFLCEFPLSLIDLHVEF